MFLTAQHVLNPSTGMEGINAYSYRHGPYTWHGLPPTGIPDQNPGTLESQSTSVQPPGNRIRSYLDIVAPDETGREEIRQGFIAFISSTQRQPFPWAGVVGRCLFRVNMDFELSRNWQHELAQLYRAAQNVRIGG